MRRFKVWHTVHSLITTLACYAGIQFILISPPELEIPDYIRDTTLIQKNIPFQKEVERLEDVIGDLDVLVYDPCAKRTFFQ